eukprot:452212-Prymnesium_polylepis.5
MPSPGSSSLGAFDLSARSTREAASTPAPSARVAQSEALVVCLVRSLHARSLPDRGDGLGLKPVLLERCAAFKEKVS